jgi:serine/threonine protein kinase
MSDEQPQPAPTVVPPTTFVEPTPPPSPHECETVSGFNQPTPAVEPTVPPELANHTRYRIVRLLGVGGMGAVYQAEHRVMERFVALKVIRADLVSNAAAVKRFQIEVRTAAKLTHQNIVTAFDAEQIGNVHFLVMEYVEGNDLATMVATRGPLPASEACYYIAQAAMGLQHAYERGMIHRDIKPQNLMVAGAPYAPLLQRTVKILDFGLARFASAATSGHTASGTLLGTVDYMAPEQADNAHAADIRSDLYSLGCTLFYLLAGRALFPEGTLVQKVMCHVERTPPLSELPADLPPGLTDVLARLLAKKPEERYQTPSELVLALSVYHPGFLASGSQTAIPALSAAAPPPFVPPVEPQGQRGTSTRLPGASAKPLLFVEPPKEVEPRPRMSVSTTPRLRKARWRRSFARKVLLGCFVLAALAIASSGIVKVLDSLKGPNSGGTQGGDVWDHLERNWMPPSNAEADKLFPAQLGEYRRMKTDDQADVPSLDIHHKGLHGHYQADKRQMDLFIYQIREQEKKGLYLDVLDALEKHKGKKGTRPPAVTGTPKESRLTYHVEAEKGKNATEPGQRGVLWWNRGWLFLMQTEGAVDPEPLLLQYLSRGE